MPQAERLPRRVTLDQDATLDLLREGSMEVRGRLVDASNTTLFAMLTLDGAEAACIYKPVRGERPLWDFPDGTLAHREVAAYAVSEATGWQVVPPTVFRDGPFGPGMCQLWIDVDEDIDVMQLIHSGDPQLQRMAVFDAVVNNADRKGGHLLPTADGHLFGVDHGVCFAVQNKLRTILWNWRGEALPEDAVEVLHELRVQLSRSLGDQLGELLTSAEVSATCRRIDRLLRTGRFPQPSGQWPAIPWPPF